MMSTRTLTIEHEGKTYTGEVAADFLRSKAHALFDLESEIDASWNASLDSEYKKGVLKKTHTDYRDGQGTPEEDQGWPPQGS